MTQPFAIHKAWASTLGGVFLFVLLLGPLSSFLTSYLEAKIIRLSQDQERLITQIHQMEADAESAEELSQSIEAKDIQSSLAPMNRGMMAVRLEAAAAAARIINFTFALSPPTPWPGNNDFPNIKGVMQSRLTFDAETPTDVDVLRFLSALAELPGRLDLLSLSLSRKGQGETMARTNIHVKGEINWLYNQERGRP